MSSQEKFSFLKDPDADEVEKTVFRPDITFEQSQELYQKWAEIGTYDNVHGSEANLYSGQAMLMAVMKSLFSDVTAVRVLDAGAGTGLTGEVLHNLGYTNIDGLEPVEGFANKLRQTGIYTSVYNQPISADTPLNQPDNTYDAVVVVGAFGPGAIPPSAVLEFIRLVKPGGYFVNCMREEYLWTVPMYRDTFEPMMKELEKQGRLKELEWTVYPKHFQDKTGVRMVYRIC